MVSRRRKRDRRHVYPPSRPHLLGTIPFLRLDLETALQEILTRLADVVWNGRVAFFSADFVHNGLPSRRKKRKLLKMNITSSHEGSQREKVCGKPVDTIVHSQRPPSPERGAFL
jgi:hypothetical protein